MRKFQILILLLANTAITILIVIGWDYYKSKSRGTTEKNMIGYPLGKNIPDSLKREISLRLINGEVIKLSEYPKGETDKDVLNSVDAHFCDLNKDETPELWASFNQGGNAAVNQDCLFIKEGNNLFKQIFFFEGGTEPKDNFLKLYLNDDMKYFHACGACALEEEFDMFPEIEIEFNSNRLFFSEPNPELNRKIEVNIQNLGKAGIQEFDNFQQDNGTRKAYALNALLYYYNNNGDLDKTKALYDSNYFQADKEALWLEIKELILGVLKNVELNKK